MACTRLQVEGMAAWCWQTATLEAARTEAWETYFAENDPQAVNYRFGGGDRTGQERRFLSWFMFYYRLPSGRLPGELAAETLFTGRAREEPLRAVHGARFVFAAVATVLPGKSVFLELGRERFEVPDGHLSRMLKAGGAIFAHLVPTGRRGQWMIAPGWVQWPFEFGPTMRQELEHMQFDPIAMERMLQFRRPPGEDEDRPERAERPHDTTLDAAVERMTAAARAARRPRLIMSPREWSALVPEHLHDLDPTGFTREIIARAEPFTDESEVGTWIALSSNIWNNTPQPDRGGKTPNELRAEEQPLVANWPDPTETGEGMAPIHLEVADVPIAIRARKPETTRARKAPPSDDVRIGKQPPRYDFFLNPYSDVRFTTCPKCGAKTKQRKLPLVIHIDPAQLISLNKTCRYCPACDLLIAHQDEIEGLLAAMCEGRGQMEFIGNDYLVIGTVDRPVWKRGTQGELSAREMLDNVHDFNTYLNFELLPRWAPADPEPDPATR